MTVLDCESIGSIYGSLEAIAGAKRRQIESFLDSMDLKARVARIGLFPSGETAIDKLWEYGKATGNGLK